MPYTIKKTDGTILLTLGDTRVNQVSTSLTLIGKDVEPYGEYFNNDLVGLLENFASTLEPRAPLVGQLWYNKGVGKIYVYTESKVFKPVGGSLLSNAQPTQFDQGDFWIDTDNKQLWFSPTGDDFVLAGPGYSSLEGRSGWIVEKFKDNNKIDQTVASLYIKNDLMAIASTQDFTFDLPYKGMNSVQVGVNLNQSIPNIRFIGTATSGESFNGFTPTDYYQKNDDIVTEGYIWPQSLEGLKVGPDANVEIYLDEFLASTVEHTRQDTFFRIKANNVDTGPFDAITIDPAKKIGILNDSPSYTVDINGNTRIQGNLIVEGNTVNIESTTLTVNDKNIELAYGQAMPNDAFVEGGGITLHGTDDKTITWTQNFGNSWVINDNLNLDLTNYSYKIGGQNVLTYTAIGASVTSAEGLTKLGFLNYLTVTNLILEGHTISTTATSADLVLTTADPTATIDVDGRRIKNLDLPVDNTDAASKQYVLNNIASVSSKGFVFSLDVTNAVNTNTFVIGYLNKMLPVTNTPPDDVYNLPDGVRSRVLCSTYSIPVPQQILSINESTTLVNGTQTVVTNVAGTLPAFSLTPSISYQIKEFRIISGAWQYTADIP